MNRLVKVAMLLVPLFLSACGTSKNIQVGTSPELDSDTGVLVFGLSPNCRIHLTRGRVENNIWNRPNIDFPEINIFPEKGYVVVKARRTRESQALGRD